MFSTEFLHIVRDYEIDVIARYFHVGASILEIGGGTGYQAKRLSERGFKVTSIDVADSNYKGDRVFLVTDYDGKVFPFEDATFDIVFSSNALEHIRDLDRIHEESQRVLKPGGYCVHVMPTAVWRFWSGVTHYVDLVQRLFGLFRTCAPQKVSLDEPVRMARGACGIVRLVKTHAIAPRHGEFGNAFTELWTFSRRAWLNHFRKRHMEVISADPIGLFYTGYMVLGKRWALDSRRLAARILGSASVVYTVRFNSSSSEERTP